MLFHLCSNMLLTAILEHIPEKEISSLHVGSTRAVFPQSGSQSSAGRSCLLGAEREEKCLEKS